MDRKAQSLDGLSGNSIVSTSAEKTEEADYVNVAEGAERNKGAAPGQKFPSFSPFFPLLAAYWLILLVVVPLHIHFHLIAQFELKQLKANQTLQLKANQTLLLEKNYNFTTELDEMKKENQELRRERKNLTEQIKNMEETWNEQNVSRAQWSVDLYCPKANGRRCTSCQRGWSEKFSSCYAYNDAPPAEWRNWTEAREDCTTKNSDLPVVFNQTEKDYVNTQQSPAINGIKGYWIGLRAEGGKWKWIDGSELTNQTWIQQQYPVDGQCVTSLQNRGWSSVSCDEKNAWICEKKALSV